MNSFEKRLRTLEAMPRRQELAALPPGMQRIGSALFVPLPVPRERWASECAAWHRIQTEDSARLIPGTETRITP